MSFVSTASTLNIGNSTSTTVNITQAATLNLGNSSGTVTMKGINIPFETNYAICNNNATTGSDTTDKIGYCFLPFSTTQYLIFRWGYRKDPGDGNDTTVTFSFPFDTVPFVFATKWEGGQGSVVIKTISTAGFTCDSSLGSTGKAAINWLAIGLNQ